MALFHTNKEDGLEALLQLKKTQAVQNNEKLANIYERLVNGRNAFANVYELNVKAVSQISALNQEIKFYTEKLEEITDNVSTATREIHEASAESRDVAEMIAERHEDLTGTIINISERSENVYGKIEEGQKELTEIRQLSSATIEVSEVMHTDMEELSNVIVKMNDVIEGINAISSQTNLLSLNASIEAARAGEAGKGFAVVADEIRSLADETQSLTQNMGEFVQGVRNASKKSAESVENAIRSLETVNDKIKHVWAINEENQKHIAGITENISSLAAVSEEISSSMNEIEAKASEIENSCGMLRADVDGLQNISESCTVAIQPLGQIEEGVDHILVQMGRMSADPFYALNKEEIAAYLDGAIEGHRKWIEKLSDIVESQQIIPLILDETKCAFGHFYASMMPPVQNLTKVWDEIGAYHKELHKSGSMAIQALFDEDYRKADESLQAAKECSGSLVEKLTYIKENL